MSCKVLGFLVSGLLFLALQAWTDACSCGPSHPQHVYCQSHVVIKGKIISSKLVGRGNSTDPSGFQWIQYEVQQLKMFKGSEKVERVEYVYTPQADFVCGFVLEADQLNKDYVLSGNVETDGKIYVNICGFNKLWSQLTSSQRAGLAGNYEAGCQCKIVPCLSLPCSISADNQCLWTDGIIDGNWAGSQSRRCGCSMKSSGLCQWEFYKRPRTPAVTRDGNQ
uniref:metalloproteinase inhibitor 2-like n=1 Tax=Pristiophorus japonicus TaxID=55135 RepID=UPI00398F275A